MNIKTVRKEIDLIDDQMLELFARRMALGKTIGKMKEAQHIPIENSSREREILLKISRESGESK